MRKISLILITVFFFVYSAGWSQKAEISPEAGPASGSVVNGYRILSIQKNKSELNLTVYRGDYIKFKLDPSMQDPLLSIPDLAIQKRLSNNLAEAPYFKMKKPGTFAFSLEDVAGSITVINYRQASYREVSSREAAELIKNEQPIILDVRTPKEYKRGHLHNSVLIPVQELQSRQKELGAHKDREILIYCATGNRSTVASKILIDNGFKHIVNMRGGTYDWSKKNYPVTR
ncbi:MAG: rhodanese-like domain-containing protein [Deltaproteobacteria bacterium]|nr:rhodanese-like domain-containing protein [Deltaproteobacteria bacterium]